MKRALKTFRKWVINPSNAYWKYSISFIIIIGLDMIWMINTPEYDLLDGTLSQEEWNHITYSTIVAFVVVSFLAIEHILVAIDKVRKQKATPAPPKEYSSFEIMETYHWIKVEPYTDNPNLPLSVRLEMLQKHHIKETNFLISKIRDMHLEKKSESSN